jgi:hypothetical protein
MLTMWPNRPKVPAASGSAAIQHNVSATRTAA